MAAASPPSNLQPLLESDRTWCAYALADLDPYYAPSCTWHVNQGAVVLIYTGLTPPVLFAHGDPTLAGQLFEKVPPGRYQYTLMGVHRDLLGSRLVPDFETSMWRMAFKPSDFPGAPSPAPDRLSPADLSAIAALTGDHPDRPDAFTADQLAQGVFFGVRDKDRLLAIAGTHVLAADLGVAAVGNVFTDPAARGRGLGSRVTAAVVHELVEMKISTIVLNVAMHNQAAVRVYQKLGFWPYRGYYEGVALLKNVR